MVEAHGVDGVEALEVIAVRREVAVPRNDVERRMLELGHPQPSGKLLHGLAAPGLILEMRRRDFEVARRREPVQWGDHLDHEEDGRNHQHEGQKVDSMSPPTRADKLRIARRRVVIDRTGHVVHGIDGALSLAQMREAVASALAAK